MAGAGELTGVAMFDRGEDPAVQGNPVLGSYRVPQMAADGFRIGGRQRQGEVLTTDAPQKEARGPYPSWQVETGELAG